LASNDPAGADDRIAALDGLRGIAALVVVLFHCMLASPTIMGRSSPDGLPSPGWEWWAAHTPLHLLWAGPEAVVVFFALSGLVLTLPFLNGEQVWRAYYARRLVRLYLPVWASIAFTAALMVVLPRVASAAQSNWVHDRATSLSTGAVANDASLWSATVTLNAPLWSLHYELLFSLLLPLYLWFALTLRRWWAAKFLTVFAVVGIGVLTHLDAVLYMPVFAIGVLLAVERERIARRARTVLPWQWAILFAAAGVLLIVHWLGIPGEFLAAAVGAAILVVGVPHCRAAGRVACLPPAQWLGKRSFSLYLVHEPIVVTAILVTGATAPLVPVLIALPCSLALAALMYAVVERPAHRLARRVGRGIEQRVRQRAQQTPLPNSEGLVA
jgi:peptidoglycan/LPS O-acetylase OafA/YrhL